MAGFEWFFFFVVDGIEIWDHLDIFIYWMKFHSKKCFLAFLNNNCIINIFLQENLLIYERREDYRSTLHYFYFLFFWWYFMNYKHNALWTLKKCKLYILCKLILFNLLHLFLWFPLSIQTMLSYHTWAYPSLHCACLWHGSFPNHGQAF